MPEKDVEESVPLQQYPPNFKSDVNINDCPDFTMNTNKERTFHRYEIDLNPTSEQIATLHEVPFNHLEMSKVEKVPEQFDLIQNVVYPLLDEFEVENLEALKCLQTHEKMKRMKDIYSIIPTSGCLNPKKIGKFFLRFPQVPDTSFNGVISCHVDGGLTKTLNISGKSKGYSFSIDRDFFEFGRQVMIICKKGLSTVLI